MADALTETEPSQESLPAHDPRETEGFELRDEASFQDNDPGLLLTSRRPSEVSPSGTETNISVLEDQRQLADSLVPQAPPQEEKPLTSGQRESRSAWTSARRKNPVARDAVFVAHDKVESPAAVSIQFSVKLKQIAQEIGRAVEGEGKPKAKWKRYVQVMQMVADPHFELPGDAAVELKSHFHDVSMLSSDARLLLLNQVSEEISAWISKNSPSKIPSRILNEHSQLQLALQGGLATTRECCQFLMGLPLQSRTWFGLYRSCTAEMKHGDVQRVNAAISRTITAARPGASANEIASDVKVALANEFDLKSQAASRRKPADWELACLAEYDLREECRRIRDVLGRPDTQTGSWRNALNVFLRSNERIGKIAKEAYKAPGGEHQKKRLANIPHRAIDAVAPSIFKKMDINELSQLRLNADQAKSLYNEHVDELTAEATTQLQRAFNNVNVDELPLKFCRLVAAQVKTVEEQMPHDMPHRSEVISIALSNVGLRILGSDWNKRTDEEAPNSDGLKSDAEANGHRQLRLLVDRLCQRIVNNDPERCGFKVFMDRVLARGKQ